jgi:hypothetical protein
VVISLRRFSALSILCGTLVLAAWLSAGLAEVGRFNSTEDSVEVVRVVHLTALDEQLDTNHVARSGEESVPLVGTRRSGVVLHDTDPVVPSTTPAVRTPPLSTLDATDSVRSDSASGSGEADLANAAPIRPSGVVAALLDDLMQQDEPNASSLNVLEACPQPEVCIDQYLWSLYVRAPKVDTGKVKELIKVTVKKKGKTQIVTRTLIKYVTQDFAWKDPIAAEKAGMSLKDYVIGGMDRSFKRKLYHALWAMEGAGLSPGITSGFRDDYRQALASGNKAAADSSYHGGSRRGGYGYGLAADLVSVRGETRAERIKWSQILWKWIDAHENELGIGRPYLDRDPPHVGPTEGKEYVQKRSRAKTTLAASAKNTPTPLILHDRQAMAKSAKPARSAKPGSQLLEASRHPDEMTRP